MALTPELNNSDWVRLTETLEAFSQAWSSSSLPPSIIDFLPAHDSPHRNELASELIKLDLEHRWQRGLRRLVEEYSFDIPDLDTLLSVELVFEEYHIRKTAGDRVSPTEYFRRFPSLARDLDGMFRMDPALRSTFVQSATPSTTLQLAPGDTIDDFDILLTLGKGTFATVFLARQKSMQRMVALKLSADHGSEPQTLAKLDHDNIIRVYDQRLIPAKSARLLYMQYAAGGTLSDIIGRLKDSRASEWCGRTYLKAIDSILDDRGESRPTESEIRRRIAAMTWPQLVCWVGLQLAEALDYAHREGVLHRDIKPANVLITAEGVPKFADFNISFGASVEGATADASLGGSLAYMSPEQLEACNPRHVRNANELDGRSDLFSLGVVICELLLGQRPFAEAGGQKGVTWLESITERRRHGLSDANLRALCKSEAAGLDEVICRCLEPDPDDRFSTGAALARSIDLCLNPDARRLLCDTTTPWKRVVSHWPLVSIIIVTLIPNIVGAIFNFLYNRGEIQNLIPNAVPVFMRIQSTINLITFPVGILIAFWLAGSVTRATRVDIQSRMSQDEIARQRRRCLELGNVASMVGLVLWLVAAPAYPILLHAMHGDVPAAIYGHFVVSLALCGLIAAAYPFFAVSIMALRCLYPTLVRWESISEDELPALRNLARFTWFHLILAASVPMLSITILALSGLDRRTALVQLAVGGVLGFGLAVSAFRLLQQDLQVLMRVIERSAR
ncbi:MAG: serine/threonine protein kinase [Planctomycetaceae bacterium]|nr:serine/threonine protein kinase [Planctomycetaceae bacterium]